MEPRRAPFFRTEIHNFSRRRARPSPAQETFLAVARSQVCCKRSFWVALIISNSRN
jgi:hypothetical protein